MRDEGQLAQAIQNLVRNAIEAMPSGGLVQIEIDVRPTAEVGNRKEVCIAVIDRGAGIEPSKLDRIWRARCRNSVAAMDPNANLVVSSGYSEDGVMSDYAKHGFKAVLPKPYNSFQLIAAVAQLIDT